MLSNLMSLDRFWWVFLILAILGLCILEGIAVDAVDRKASKLNPRTRKRIAWGIFICALALAAFLFVRGIYFYAP
jgi:hypothetical protein